MSMSIDRLQQDIQILQQRMAARVETIKQEFEPMANVARDLTGSHDASLQGTLDSIQELVRRYPIPTALVAAGLAGIGLQRSGLMETNGMGRSARSTAAAAGSRMSQTGRQAGKTAGRALETARGQLADGYDATVETAQQAYESGRQAAAEGYESMRQTAAQAQRQARRNIEKATSQGSAFVRENPVATGLMAAALGAAVASIFLVRRPSEWDEPTSRASTPARKASTRKKTAAKSRSTAKSRSAGKAKKTATSKTAAKSAGRTKAKSTAAKRSTTRKTAPSRKAPAASTSAPSTPGRTGPASAGATGPSSNSGYKGPSMPSATPSPAPTPGVTPHTPGSR